MCSENGGSAGTEQRHEAFTGQRRRSRKTRPAVLFADRAAGVFITLGGIGTIVAVTLVCVFLVYVVIPLFLPESMRSRDSISVQRESGQPDFVHVAAEEYLNMGWAATSSGDIVTYRLDNGRIVSKQNLAGDRQLVAWAFSLRGGHVALAYEDNHVQIGTIDFETTFVPDEEVPSDLRQLAYGDIASFRDGILEVTPEGQYRLQELKIKLQGPVQIETESKIKLIDLSESSRGTIFATITESGELRIARVTQRKNLLTGKITTRLKEGMIQVDLPDGQLPAQLLLAGLGDTVMLAWEDGQLQRFDTRDASKPVYAESLELLEEPTARVTSLGFMVGKTSLVVGDSQGHVSVWFRTRPDDAFTVDGATLVKAQDLPVGPAGVTGLASSPRSRMLATAYADGCVRLFHVTSEQRLAEVSAAESTGRINSLTISPKDDAVVALTESNMFVWEIDAPHPESTWSSIFGKVWYEGYEHPEHVWQSSSGTDDFEAKYGLVSLVFGSLKATFYSMLFGAPLALLAAIYTSEFLNPRSKAYVKPTIEIMASLPSVVLGFLAALVFAPIVEDIVPEFLAAFVTIPFAYMLGAYLWQLIPTRIVVQARRFRMWGMVLALPAGIWLAQLVGPVIERWLFASDIKAWLDGQIGTGTGAWMFILLPVSGVLVVWVMSAFVTPWLRRAAGAWDRTPFAILDLGKFFCGCLAVVLVAYLLSSLLNSLGWDPRGTFVDTYVQRNALVVGFIMGFAIIPIIYTISDDALSAVPESLRAGSLGAGATQWQTAVRIVVPTAMSGLFSAMMVGLGRAVGETMIVLMAAGNTPVMDLNIFNGFRTLSANIAVELPEAVLNSTHYRMLFLAALSLFVITFVVNTIAELVRLRFRKRAFQL